jgi:hypothetical protein
MVKKTLRLLREGQKPKKQTVAIEKRHHTAESAEGKWVTADAFQALLHQDMCPLISVIFSDIK